MADAAATQGMNGIIEHMLLVAQYVNDLMGRMAWRADTADAAHDPHVLEAISDADTRAEAGVPST